MLRDTAATRRLVDGFSLRSDATVLLWSTAAPVSHSPDAQNVQSVQSNVKKKMSPDI